MSRRMLTDEQWERIEGHLPGRAGTRGRSGVDNRLFVDAILWMAGNAARWRDLPEVLASGLGSMRGSGAGRMPASGRSCSRHGRHAGLRARPDRQHHLEGPRRCEWRKRRNPPRFRRCAASPRRLVKSCSVLATFTGSNRLAKNSQTIIAAPCPRPLCFIAAAPPRPASREHCRGWDRRGRRRRRSARPRPRRGGAVVG